MIGKGMTARVFGPIRGLFFQPFLNPGASVHMFQGCSSYHVGEYQIHEQRRWNQRLVYLVELQTPVKRLTSLDTFVNCFVSMFTFEGAEVIMACFEEPYNFFNRHITSPFAQGH